MQEPSLAAKLEWTMVGNMFGELLSHAGLDRAHEALLQSIYPGRPDTARSWLSATSSTSPRTAISATSPWRRSR